MPIQYSTPSLLEIHLWLDISVILFQIHYSQFGIRGWLGIKSPTLNIYLKANHINTQYICTKPAGYSRLTGYIYWIPNSQSPTLSLLHTNAQYQASWVGIESQLLILIPKFNSHKYPASWYLRLAGYWSSSQSPAPSQLHTPRSQPQSIWKV